MQPRFGLPHTVARLPAGKSRRSSAAVNTSLARYAFPMGSTRARGEAAGAPASSASRRMMRKV